VAGYRLARRQSMQQALMGLVSVAVAAAIAARTGEARGFFLLGIASSVVYAAVFALSVVVRRPLVGVLWEFLDPTPISESAHWRRVPVLFRAYVLATLAAFAMFASRATVQLSLFQDNRTGWLAVTRLVMGFPLYIAVVGFAFWVVHRARTTLAGQEPDSAHRADLPASESDEQSRSQSVADGLTDGGLSLGERDEQ
jgi:hypothetical protein